MAMRRLSRALCRASLLAIALAGVPVAIRALRLG